MSFARLTRGRRLGVAAAGVVLLVMLLAWQVLPRWLRSVAQERGSEALGRAVTIEAMRFNPLTLTLAVEGLRIEGPSPKAEPLLKLARAEVNADIRSLWRGAPVVEGLVLQSPEMNFARLAEGRYDIDDVLARLKAKPQAATADEPPPRFALYNVLVNDGRLRFDDRPKARLHEVRDLHLGLPFLSNLDDALDVEVAPRLAFQLDDTAFDTGAQAKPFARERAGTLTLKTGDLDVTDWLPYLPASLPLRPVSGSLGLDLTLQFKLPAAPDGGGEGGKPEAVLKGSVRANKVKLVDAAEQPLAELASLSVQLGDVQPLRRRVSLGTVEVDGFQVDVARSAQGELNWLKALGGGSAETSPAVAPVAAASNPASAPVAAAVAAPAWQVSLARLQLKDSQVRWRDQAVQPEAALAVQGLAAEAQDLRWPLAEGGAPARLKVQAGLSNLASPTEPAAKQAKAEASPDWQLQGEWSAKGGQAQWQSARWPLAWAGPYLAAQLKPRLEGALGFDATARWQGAPGDTPPTLTVAALTVDDFKATEPAQRQAAASWKQLRVNDLALDLAQRTVVVGRLAWEQPQLRAARNAAGELDLAQWWKAPAAAPAATEPASATEPWRLQLQTAELEGGRLAWADAAAGGEPVALDLQQLKLSAKGLQWPASPDSAAPLQGSVSVATAGGAAGAISWQGELGLAPLAWRGNAKVERFPVHAVASYALAALPVTLDRAEAGWAGDVTARWAPEGLSLQMKGDARLNDLRLYPRTARPVAPGESRGDPLLSWQALSLPSVKLALVPGQRTKVELGQGTVSDFYAQLMVAENGRFNLADLGNPSAPVPVAPTSAPASAASAPPAAAAAGTAADQPLPLDLAMGGLVLKNGRVDFSDHFVRPNYSAVLSDLNGQLGGFRTGTREMASLDLTGRVAGTGQLKVQGALNPTAKPLALDVQARASDLELAPLSPYAGKYAGYAIERGKLMMDVSYRIDADGRLDAKNQIVLNQLTFGERIESPDATKLPVLLAVALLKDRHGVIDLNLPIGGSLNDPEFSIGGVVMKLIGNLLAKALTAPFALLSGGDDDDAGDLSQIPFEPGSARLGEGAEASFDKVVQSLAERPALKLTLTGIADPQAERDGLQSRWLEDALRAEQRKEQRGGSAAATAAWTPEERARWVRRVYADAPLPDKPRNALGLAKDLPVAEMERLLKTSRPVSVDNVRELAVQRAVAVRDALLAKGLAKERVTVAAARVRAAADDGADADWAPRVQLSLGTD